MKPTRIAVPFLRESLPLRAYPPASSKGVAGPTIFSALIVCLKLMLPTPARRSRALSLRQWDTTAV